jgi:hypothetical protein
MEIKFVFNKYYYKYINTSIVNHYRLLLLTEEYLNISKNYYHKYPTANGWINLNKELFYSNKQAEIDYIEASKMQSKIKEDFFKNIEIVCKNCKNKEFIICSNSFQKKYLNHKYHYEQSIEHIIENIMKDIHNIDKNS